MVERTKLRLAIIPHQSKERILDNNVFDTLHRDKI